MFQWKGGKRATFPHAAVEPAAVSLIVRTLAAGVLLALAWSGAPYAEAQAPIRIGATTAQTGVSAQAGQNLLRGYQLCVKQTNEKGGVLGRTVELLARDDGSDSAAAVRLYERLIAQDKMDLALGPWPSRITDLVANVTERHRMPMVVQGGPLSIYGKGRKFTFGMNPPGRSMEGFIDLAAKKGLKTVALAYPENIFGRGVAQEITELAKKGGLQVAFAESHPPGTTDFSAIMAKVREANPDVLVGAGRFEDTVAIIRQLKALHLNPRMVGMWGDGFDRPRFYELLGRDAEFVYGATPWLPELIVVRAGGLIPIARQYPGAREFVESYKREFPGADLDYVSAGGYGACQVLVEAVRRAGSVDGGKVRDAILALNHNTVFGPFRLDRDGIQVGHTYVVFQWQEGKRAIVWPEELAPGTLRFPTPPWNQRP